MMFGIAKKAMAWDNFIMKQAAESKS